MKDDNIAGPRRGGARKSQGRCPICDAPSQHRVRPFCSKRCQDVDLGRWLRGGYRIPTEERLPEAAPGDGAQDDDDNPFGGV